MQESNNASFRVCCGQLHGDSFLRESSVNRITIDRMAARSSWLQCMVVGSRLELEGHILGLRLQLEVCGTGEKNECAENDTTLTNKAPRLGLWP